MDYYIEATDADNHAVREAACACIAELGAKVGWKQNFSERVPLTAKCAMNSCVQKTYLVKRL